jgi:hypothetical protein
MFDFVIFFSMLIAYAAAGLIYFRSGNLLYAVASFVCIQLSWVNICFY